MKKLIYSLAFVLIIHCTLNIDNCMCQWLQDLRLTNDPANSLTSLDNRRNIDENGNLIHVVWFDERNNGNAEIYYKRSPDGGGSWGADTRLTNHTNFSSGCPAVSVSGNYVHVAWYTFTSVGISINYIRSTDGGLTWGNEMMLATGTGSYYCPMIAASGLNVHLVWRDNHTGPNEINYKRSTDGGTTWGTSTQLSNASPGSALEPCISVSGSNVHVVWNDSRNGNYEIYYTHSTDGGLTWSANIRMTNNTYESRFPSIAVYNSNVHIVWTDYGNSNWSQVYYKRSLDGGASWGQNTYLAKDFHHPAVAACTTVVHVISTDGNTLLYLRSRNNGNSWVDKDTIAKETGMSEFPSIATSGSSVDIVWRESRDGNREIYYKSNPFGNSIGIKKISSEVPDNYSLSQNYPNPFNPSTIINYSISKNTNVQLKVFNMQGKEIASLVNEKQNAGIYEVTFDASEYPSGVYFYRMITDGFSETKKMILVK